MIFFKRKRFLVWLVKAYLNRWKKIILFSFIIGLIGFFGLSLALNYIFPSLPFFQREKIGIVGAYTFDNLPNEVLVNVSKGLTVVDDDGTAKPGAATHWEIRDDGKTYIFYLDEKLKFSDGSSFNSESINYNFLDVKSERPNENTIVFRLKEPYSPFIVTVSRPIFKKRLVGLGEYRIKSIDQDQDFIKSLTLTSKTNKTKVMSYEFYPTEEALKMAYILGEITKAEDVEELKTEKVDISTFKNAKIEKSTDYRRLITLFYNFQDPTLSDKRIREALTYSVPDKYSQGEKSYTSISPYSWAYQEGLVFYTQDLARARDSISKSQTATKGASLRLVLQTPSEYEGLAKELKEIWKGIGIDVVIKTTEEFPSEYQIYLGEFRLPRDPDQYTLWHSSQPNNITSYKNLRIDKLLEDGRKTADVQSRQKIYADFQKYLFDDYPATFLYFPFEYDISRN